MKVTNEKWAEVADNLKKRREDNPITPNLDLYKRIVKKVHIGNDVLDVGAGQCYLQKCLPKHFLYLPVDPFPFNEFVVKMSAEDLIYETEKHEFATVFMLAALDNVKDVELSLKGLKHVASENIVILTGIDIEPDQYHTHKITRQMLVDALGHPKQEIEVLPKVFLFEWSV